MFPWQLQHRIVFNVYLVYLLQWEIFDKPRHIQYGFNLYLMLK